MSATSEINFHFLQEINANMAAGYSAKTAIKSSLFFHVDQA
jgi:hypothetical protein